jgi:MFS family permease
MEKEMVQLQEQTAESYGARGLIASFLVLNITTGTVGGAMQLVVPLYAMSLQASTAEIGIIRGISGIGMLLLVIPAGFLVDHFGSKRLFLVGALAGTMFTFALSLARVPLALTILMGLAGLFSSLKMTALNASFFRNLRDMGIEKAGWFKGSMSIGLTFLGPVLGGYLARTISFPAAFRLLAWLTLIPTALVFFFHTETIVPGKVSELGSAIRSQLHQFAELIRRREIYLPLFTESLSTGCFATFSTFIVVLAVKVLQLPATSVSLLLTLEGGVFILTVFAGSPLITRLTRLQLYLVSVGVTSAGLIGISLGSGLWSIAAATAVLGLGLGLINLVTSSRIGRMKGDKGKIVGLFAAAVGAGISLGPMLGGAIGQQCGVQWIFFAFVPLFITLAILAGKEGEPAQ